MSQLIDVSIISSGANIADARLHRIAGALLRAGLNVEVFAPGNPADGPRESAPGQLFIRRGGSSKSLLARYFRSRSYPMRARGKVFYAISPEAFAPTHGFAFMKRRKFAVDLYEDYIRVLKDRPWARKYFGLPGLLARLDTKLALWFAQRAHLTTVADTQVPPFIAYQRIVLRNLPDLTLLTMSGQRDATPRAIYIGDLRTSRGLKTMLQSAILATEWRLDLVGPIAPHDQKYVEDWISKNPEAAARVKFFGKLPPAQAWKVAAGAWVGLSLLESTPAFIQAVPSKLYEYMVVGVASISTPLPRCVDLIEKSRGGMLASDPAEVAAALDDLSKNTEKLDQMRKSASGWASSNLDSQREYLAFTHAISALIAQ
jgi:glycosyltransferase involved in cell wall biosynthesis